MALLGVKTRPLVVGCERSCHEANDVRFSVLECTKRWGTRRRVHLLSASVLGIRSLVSYRYDVEAARAHSVLLSARLLRKPEVLRTQNCEYQLHKTIHSVASLDRIPAEKSDRETTDFYVCSEGGAR